MPDTFYDIHPHVISGDFESYPSDPLFGKRSEWSEERPVDIDALIREMDEAGISKGAIVQSSTCYGFDNSYVCDACALYPERFTAVGSIDMMAPDAVEVAKKWMARGLTGLRLFTGGTTKAFDTSAMDHPDSFKVWDFCGAEGLPICIQTGPVGLTQIAALAHRFPKTKIILDHFSRPDISDGAPFNKAVGLWSLPAFDNVHLKFTPRITDKVTEAGIEPRLFYDKLLGHYGSDRIAWGSNFPANEGTMMQNLNAAKEQIGYLPEADQVNIFSGTAAALYPALKAAKSAAA